MKNPPRKETADRPHPVALTDETIVHDGFRRYAIYRISDPDGGAEDEYTRELLVTHRTAAVLPVDRATGELVLLRQFRIGAHLATGRGMMIEIVAGAVDEGESMEEAARREIVEEIGLPALTLEKAVDFMPSPGMTNEFTTLFVAEVDASALPEIAGTGMEERIYPFRVPLETALAAADRFEIVNGFTLLALNWYARAVKHAAGEAR